MSPDNFDKVTTIAEAEKEPGQISHKVKALFVAKWLLKLLTAVPVVIVIALILHLAELAPINLSPFTTRGSIYVDSPEIYTRERLVNDRYDQDFWLREQLRKLDQSPTIVATEIDKRVSGGISKGVPPQSSQTPTQEEKKQDNPKTMPFDQDFRIRSAIRDNIRQLVLENMLDDRHDLSGNSIYGLKFDTSVIPGTNTQERAFVRIKLTVPDPFELDAEKLERIPNYVKDEQELSPHVQAYFKLSLGQKDPFKPGEVLHDAQHTYLKWLNNYENRLNQYLSGLYLTDEFIKKCSNALQGGQEGVVIIDSIRETVREVLGYNGNSGMFMPHETDRGVFRVLLPKPWVKFIDLRYSHRIDKENKNEACSVPPVFSVQQKWDAIYVYDNNSFYQGKNNKFAKDYHVLDGKGNDRYVEFGNTIGARVLTFQINKNDNLASMYEKFEERSPSFKPDDLLIDLECTNEKILAKDCLIFTPSGLFNFIESVGKSDSYSYAVFPKNEVAGIFSNSLINMEVKGQLQDSSWLNFAQGSHESKLESMLVGFGDGNTGNTNNQSGVGGENDNQAIQFGWVFGSAGTMAPEQKTELVLISIPAWATKLYLNIKTGWLDRDANEITTKGFNIEVPVPPDYQPLDALVLEGWFQRKPKILNNLMPDNIRVFACEDAKILIPGSRLWRSAAVTLGSQKANKISVLPNMGGIIAEFTPIEIPRFGEDKIIKEKLQVWTSEGMDTAENEIEIQLPDEAKSCSEIVNERKVR